MCVGTGYPEEQGCVRGIPPVGTTKREERRDSEEQKDKCREAAKNRRSKETEYFQELENLLPLSKQSSDEEETHFDKTSLLRLTIAYLKTRQVLQTGITPNTIEDEKVTGVDLLSCLDGFGLVLSSSGDVIYISDNVNRYLGLSSVDILGHPFSCYVHPCDHHQLLHLTNPEEEIADDAHKEIVVRVKCTVTKRGRMVNLKQAKYKTLKISGKTQNIKQNKVGRLTGPVFLGVARVMGDLGGEKHQLGVFTTKHGMDMKIAETDPWLCTVAGYLPHQLAGTSYYALVHGQDCKEVQRAFTSLATLGVCETSPYRLLCGAGGQVWVQTVGQVVTRRGRHCQEKFVVCRHSQISEVINREEILGLIQMGNRNNFQVETNNHRDNKNKMSTKNGSHLVYPGSAKLSKRTKFEANNDLQNSTVASIPVIIDCRQNTSQFKLCTNNQPNMLNVTDPEPETDFVSSSMEQTKPQNHQYPGITQSSPTVVTSTLFGSSKNPESFQGVNTELLQKRRNDLEHDDSYNQIDLMVIDHFFTNLMESDQLEDFERLSPHSGYESISFDQGELANDEIEMLCKEFKKEKILNPKNEWRMNSDMYSILKEIENECQKREVLADFHVSLKKQFNETFENKIGFLQKNDNIEFFLKKDKNNHQGQNDVGGYCTNDYPLSPLQQKLFENNAVYSDRLAKPPEIRKIILEKYEDQNCNDQRTEQREKFHKTEKNIKQVGAGAFQTDLSIKGSKRKYDDYARN
eukprot:GFUD01009663.1.p1 GENE.GFUD01009663.1~~GFUD01009663.1.p1  ORF type:complete len:745 (+),score=217.85 GFUD01009663.1:91-2325(+)